MSTSLKQTTGKEFSPRAKSSESKRSVNGESLFDRITKGYRRVEEHPLSARPHWASLSVQDDDDADTSFFDEIQRDFPKQMAEGRKELGKIMQRAENLTLRTARLRAGMSQKELAAATGLAQDAISQMENGMDSRNPTRNTIQKIATALNLQPEEIGKVFF